jgi:hypothetical protein
MRGRNGKVKISARIRGAATLAGVIAALALPAAAQASNDLAIKQVPSAKLVKPGETVNFKVTISNQGTEAYEAVFSSLSSLRGRGQGANNPYFSFSTSKGTCVETSGPAYGYYYYHYTCEHGPLAPGASLQITATVKVNESMNHFASLLPNPHEGGFQDDDNSNNEAVDRITVSTPPTLSGSKKIKLRGLPTGCATGDFTLRATTKVRRVKKMAASMWLGFDEEGEGQEWQKVVKGRRLVAKVPVSRLEETELGATYKLKVKAKRGGAKALKSTVTFTLC